jgi:LPS O-antigen subunit length determinant protein (WzzB/FepE family)
MNNPVENIFAPDGELNQIITSLWEGKWILAGTTLLCALAGLIVVLASPQISSVRIELKPISQIRFEDYSELNWLSKYEHLNWLGNN